MLQVRALSLAIDATVQDVSLEGFCIETATPIDVGASVEFQFRAPEFRTPIEVTATCAHSLPVVSSSGLPGYWSGFSIAKIEGASRDAWGTFIDRATVYVADPATR